MVLANRKFMRNFQRDGDKNTVREDGDIISENEDESQLKSDSDQADILHGRDTMIHPENATIKIRAMAKDLLSPISHHDHTEVHAEQEYEVTGKIRLTEPAEAIVADESEVTKKVIREIAHDGFQDSDQSDLDELDFSTPISEAPYEPDTIRLDKSSFSDSVLKVGSQSRDSVNSTLGNRKGPSDGTYEEKEKIDAKGRGITAVIRDYADSINFGMDGYMLKELLSEMDSHMVTSLDVFREHSLYNPYAANYNFLAINKDIKQIYEHMENHPELITSPYFSGLIKKLKDDAYGLYKHFNPTGTRYPSVGTLYSPNGTVISSKNPTPSVQSVSLILTPEDERRIKFISELAAKEGNEKDDDMIAEVLKFNDSKSAFENILKEGVRNFTKVTEVPSIIMEDVIQVLKTDDRFKEYREMPTRILEFGPGKGNEAVQFLLNFEKIIGYHAIEGDENTKKALDQRLYLLRASGRLKQEYPNFFDSKIVQSDYLPWFKMVPHTPEHYSGFPIGQFLIQFCESGMHYYPEDVFRKKIVDKMHKIAWAGTGIIITVLKTPKSETFEDHIVINGGSQTKGYILAQHKTQRDGSGNPLKRAFMERNAQLLIFDEPKPDPDKKINRVGFDILERTKGGDPIYDDEGNLVVNERAYVKTIRFSGYELDGKTEEFVLIIARPKGMQHSYLNSRT